MLLNIKIYGHDGAWPSIIMERRRIVGYNHAAAQGSVVAIP